VPVSGLSKYNASITDTGGIAFETPTITQNGTTKLASSRRQCGEYVNDAIGKKVFADSLQSKLTHVIEGQPPLPGAAFVLSNSGYGHVGMVEDTDGDKILISESNYDGRGGFRRIWTTMNTLKARKLAGFTAPLVGENTERTTGKQAPETSYGYSTAPVKKTTTPIDALNTLKKGATSFSSQVTTPIQNLFGKLSSSKKDAYDTLLNL